MKPLFFIAVGAMASSGAAQVVTGQVAYYKFDNSGTDQTGNSNAKVYNCSYVDDRFGNPNSALYCKGLTNSFANLGTANSLKPGEGSVSVWVNVDDTNSIGKGFDYNPIILAKNSASIGSYFEGYCLYFKRTNKKFLTITTKTGTSTERFIFSDNSCNLDQWYHLVMCYDADSLWFYVDNILQDRVPRGWTQTFASGDSVLLGASKNSTNDRYLKGAVDDLRIYNRVLDEGEIDSLYNEKIVLSANKPNKTSPAVFFYPNPTRGNIYFNAGMHVVEYSVTDISGKIILQGKEAQSLQIVAPQGIYTVKVTDSKGMSHVAKVTLTL